MTNSIAIGLGLCILSGLAADAFFNDAAASFFLAQKALDLIEWVAFWR